MVKALGYDDVCGMNSTRASRPINALQAHALASAEMVEIRPALRCGVVV
jgi:hypothetical protein